MPTHTVRGTLYHRPTTAVRGDAVLPFKMLKHAHPDLYRINARKYADDLTVVDRLVEPLGCTWGDVVFLSPVHPAPLFAALRRAGRPMRDVEPWTLDARRLDPARTTIRLMRRGATGHRADPAGPDDYLPFTTASLRAVDRITINALERLENLGPDDPLLPWVDVPHILHRGPIPLWWFAR